MDFTLSFGLSAAPGIDPHRLLAALARSSVGLPAASATPVMAAWPGPVPEQLERQASIEVPIVRRPKELFTYSLELHPLEGYVFGVRLGRQQSVGTFGLCRYPDTVFDPYSDLHLPTQLGLGWRWSSAFSAERELIDGVLPFLGCHLSLTAMLDRAEELGCLCNVNDGTGFWVQRDPLALAWRAAEWSGAASNFEAVLDEAVTESQFLRRPGRLTALVQAMSALSRAVVAS